MKQLKKIELATYDVAEMNQQATGNAVWDWLTYQPGGYKGSETLANFF